ncbi:MAG: hypothetical protein WC721_11595 [Victivallaceae bacterium]|jgi:hypothetical protein
MKTVLRNHDEVAHYWSNQIQPEGKASRLFFEGNTIFSYGHHFEIAKIVKPCVVLFTENSYSSSTGKHLSITRRAIPHHFKVFPAATSRSCYGNYSVTTDNIANLTYYLKQAEEFLNKAVRARTLAENYAKTAKHWLSIFIDYSKEFEVNTKPFTRLFETLSDTIDNFKIPEKYLAYVKSKLDAKKIAEQAKIKDWKDHLQKWKNHTGNYLDCSIPECEFDYLRIVGNEIETSKNVRLSIASALLLWRKLQQQESVKGEKIDDRWTVIDNNPKFLQVGCHKILQSEIQAMAKQLGY